MKKSISHKITGFKIFNLTSEIFWPHWGRVSEPGWRQRESISNEFFTTSLHLDFCPLDDDYLDLCRPLFSKYCTLKEKAHSQIPISIVYGWSMMSKGSFTQCTSRDLEPWYTALLLLSDPQFYGFQAGKPLAKGYSYLTLTVFVWKHLHF